MMAGSVLPLPKIGAKYERAEKIATRAKREKVGMPLPTWEGGGIDGWIIFDGPAGAGPGGGGGGRPPPEGGPPGRGRALDRLPLGDRRPRGGAPRGEADGRRAEAEDHGRGGGGVAGPARGGEPPDLGRVSRPAGRADRRPGASLDGGPGAAAVRLDVKEAEPARGRAGPRGRGRRAGGVAGGRRGGRGRGRAGALGVPGRVRRADRHGPAPRP